ncbi:MAG: STAS domain-containing protein [Candidatus Eremiobacteraeota bacterium]|nr:STAS domain-containing protein [Candidatus Eremiobacteraeota bacterium]MBV8354908.1 STAS domain-containing protein [Candidatus Eremiobacteraeota bacterium]
MSAAPTTFVVAFSGDLDVASKDEVRAKLAGADPKGRTLIDLSEVSYIDSTCLSELLLFAREVGKWGGAVAVCSPRPNVLHLLELAKVGDIIPVFDDCAAALRGSKAVH